MKNPFFRAGSLVLLLTFGFSAFSQSTGDAVAKKMGLYVFPTRDQAPELQEKDKSECYTWAVQQSGYDPINPTVVQAAEIPQGPDGSVMVGAAKGAVLGTAIGAISGDTGKGAAIGAVSGAVLGRRAGKSMHASAQNQANTEAAQANQNLEDGFRKAFTACLEAKDYSVK